MKHHKSLGFIVAFFLGSTQLLPAQWVQLGDTISGPSPNSAFGYKTSISEDGMRLAVGSPYDDSVAQDAGMVKIYDWNGAQWVQSGGTLTGATVSDQFGQEVKLSGDGSRLAVGYKNFSQNHPGRVRVFQLQNNQWLQVGQDLNGTISGEQFGIAIALSYDGTRLAAGSPAYDANGNNMSGRFSMYEFNGSMWVKRGATINGTEVEMRKGSALAMSYDGNTVVAGTLSDQVANAEVFSFDGSNWINKGAAIPGLGRFGYAIDVSADGNRLAVAGYFFPNFALGYVRVYDFENGDWTQIGSDIVGEEPGAYFGYSLQMSADGAIIALGAPGSDVLALDCGQIKVFRYQTKEWVQWGESINGGVESNRYGNALALSGDGKRIVCSSTSANDFSGEVVVFENQTVAAHEPEQNNPAIRVFPNPTSGRFRIQSSLKEPATIQIFDLNGRLQKENTRDITDLPDGLYLLHLLTKDAKTVQKIMKCSQ